MKKSYQTRMISVVLIRMKTWNQDCGSRPDSLCRRYALFNRQTNTL